MDKYGKTPLVRPDETSESGPIEIPFSGSEKDAERLRLTLQNILTQYERRDLRLPLFSSVFELATNGLKANAKSVFFEERHWDLNEVGSYPERLSAFRREVLHKKWTEKYPKKAMDR